MSPLSHLHHLWPDFSAFQSAGPEGITVMFWTLMTVVFALALVFVIWHSAQLYRRLRAIRGLIRGQTERGLAENRRDTLNKARGLHMPDVAVIWQEFDESLVSSKDRKTLYNTLDAEHFFNARTLAPGLTASRLLAATPSFLVAIGVLGTFVGLTIGLANIKASGSDAEELTRGIDQMIAGASVAFMTSVWGVLYSLALNLLEKIAERWALSQIAGLQRRIDDLYPRCPTDQALVDIADNTREGTKALQELHERIGDRLQETIQGMSEAMQQALSDTLNKIMGPAIQALVDNADKKSTQVLEELIRKFTDALSSAGNEQGLVLNEASAKVSEAVGSLSVLVERMTTLMQKQADEQALRTTEAMGQFAKQLEDLAKAAADREGKITETYKTHLGDFVSSSSDQLAALLANAQSVAQQHQQLLEHLSQASRAMADGSRHLDQSASHLSDQSTQLREASTTLSTRLADLGRQIGAAAERNGDAASALVQQFQVMDQLQRSLATAAEKGEQAAATAAASFSTLEAHQAKFLADLRKQVEALGESLQMQVMTLEDQAKQWLEAYSEAVRQQVDHRMERWNEVSLQYANQMLNTVNAISNIVDELEARQ